MAVRVGRRSAACDLLLARRESRAGAFVTAWNPLGRRRPIGWNRRMQAALLARVRRLPIVEGRGVALRGSWFEEHLLIAADPRRLIVLARRLRQHAIVVVAQGAPARLTFVRDRQEENSGRHRWRTSFGTSLTKSTPKRRRGPNALL